MRKATYISGLALLTGLTAGGVGLVFAQRIDKLAVPPPPMPVTLPIKGVVAPVPPSAEATADIQAQSEAPEKPLVFTMPNKASAVAAPEPPEQSSPLPALEPKLQLQNAQPVLTIPPTPQAGAPPQGAAVIAPPLGFQPAEPEKTPVLGTTGQPEMPAASLQGLGKLRDFSGVVESPNARQEPAVSLEWVGPASVRLKQIAPFQIIAKNTSAAAVHNVIVRYRIPEGVRIPASEPRALAEGSVLTWDLGLMSAGQEKRIDLQILPETKTVFACQASVTLTGSSTLNVQVREPQLVVTASSPTQVVQGDIATVSVNVCNTGNGDAEHVKIQARVPEGLEHTRGRMFELELGTLLPGENRTVQLVCLARNLGPQIVDCVALADAGLRAQEATKVDVVLPGLELAVSAPKLRYVDRQAVYLFKVTNPGSAAAGNVSICHEIPQGFKFHTASKGGLHDPAMRTVSWFIGDLPPGESREVSLEAVAVNIGEHRHKTVAYAARGLKTEAEAVTRVEGLSALLMELVDTDDPVEVGSDTSYQIRVTNTGSQTETNLQLVCTIPEKMEFRGAKCAADCKIKVEGREVIFDPLPQLAPRADVVYRVVLRGIAPGDMRFRARIRADGLSEPVLREESTKVYGDGLPSK